MRTDNSNLSHKNEPLKIWQDRCKKRFLNRYPKLDFDSDSWDIGDIEYINALTLKQHDKHCLRISFKPSIKKFSKKSGDFVLALRCIACEFLETNNIDFKAYTIAYDLLSQTEINSIFDLTDLNIRQIEQHLLSICTEYPIKVETSLRSLRLLENFILPKLHTNNIIQNFYYSTEPSITNQFIVLRNNYLKDNSVKRKNCASRELRVAATSDAINASFKNDPRLNSFDHYICSTLVILMVAPCRINEPLMMSVDDIISIESYRGVKNSEMKSNFIADTHLFIAMKGSKGANWAPKPALLFMHDLLLLAIERIKSYGKRSRMLLEHYEKNPEKLYLPKELEHYRLKDYWGPEEITRIIRLDSKSKFSEIDRASSVINKLVSLKPEGMKRIKQGEVRTLYLFPRKFVEQFLLDMVKDAIKKCRKEGDRQIYHGKLSKRLFLCDTATNHLEFLPNVLRYSTISRRLSVKNGPKSVITGSIFTKLGLKVPIDNKIVDAYISTHELRHFLSNSAAEYGENLSDALINKWARRLDIEQLQHYVKDNPNQFADRSAMPQISNLNEIDEIGDAIDKTAKINIEAGIKTRLVSVKETGILITHLDQVIQAIEDRPVARVSNKLMIIYPSEFGICVHQHHETPCQSYGVECLGCSDNITVKGHIPSNDAVREELVKLQKSVLNQLEKLVIEHNRMIADDQTKFADQIESLVKGTINVETLSEQLIEEFEEIKDSIININFRRRLEQAFVAKKTVGFLDDKKTMTGGVIRYHNPNKSGRETSDKAEMILGGWEKNWKEEAAVKANYPFLENTLTNELMDQSENYLDIDEED